MSLVEAPQSRVTVADHPFEVLNRVALPQVNPGFDFSAISVYCSARDLSMLYLHIVGASDAVRFHIHMVHDTLVIRSVGLGRTDRGESAPTTVTRQAKTKANASDFKKTCTLPYAGLPEYNRYFQALQYALCDLQLVVWAERDAYMLGSDQGDERLDASLPSRSDNSDTVDSAETVIERGELVPPQQLVKLASYTKYAESPKKKALTVRKFRTRDSAWLSGAHSVLWGTVDGDSGQWEKSTTEFLRPETVPANWPPREARLKQLAALLHEIKRVARASKHGVCVVTADGLVKDSEGQTGRTLEVWEPEFDIKRLDEQEVPEPYRVPKHCLPEDFVQQFWIDNKSGEPEPKI